MRRLLTAAGLLAITTIAHTAPPRQDDPAGQPSKEVAKAVTERARRALGSQGPSNEKVDQPKRVEQSYPLAGDAERAKSAKVTQQVVVDLLSIFNMYKEAHWNLSGPLYLQLHEFYQEQADYYRLQADVFAERVRHLGYSVDGRHSTVTKTTTIPDFPGGYVTDNESIKLLIDRVTVLQKEVYAGIHETEQSDPTTSNKLQDLAYSVDKNLWQLRAHIERPGGLGDDLPWVKQQAHDRAGN